jgi:hypothetical protein
MQVHRSANEAARMRHAHNPNPATAPEGPLSGLLGPV